MIHSQATTCLIQENETLVQSLVLAMEALVKAEQEFAEVG
jgi:hypothetical protein